MSYFVDSRSDFLTMGHLSHLNDSFMNDVSSMHIVASIKRTLQIFDHAGTEF